MITFSPVESKRRPLWELSTHLVGIDKTGEALAWIKNYSNTQIMMADGTPIGAIHVTRVKVSRSAKRKEKRTLALVKSPSCSNYKEDQMMAKWMEDIQPGLEGDDNHEVISSARQAMCSSQRNCCHTTCLHPHSWPSHVSLR